jgi:hypothetical protein
VPSRCQARRIDTKSNILARARAHSRSLKVRPVRASSADRAALSFSEAGLDCQRSASALSVVVLATEEPHVVTFSIHPY